MARPKQCRRIADVPAYSAFKPTGVPGHLLQEVVMSVDEFEAIRLADHDALYHAQAAKRMGVSRATFGRILDEARRKVARMLLDGCLLRIEGGSVAFPTIRSFACVGCGHAWETPFESGRPAGCPACRSDGVRRVDGEPRLP